MPVNRTTRIHLAIGYGLAFLVRLMRSDGGRLWSPTHRAKNARWMGHPDLCLSVLRGLALSVCVTGIGSHAQPSPEGAQTLDRVVATVNNHAILASDVADELRLSVLDPDNNGTALTPRRALQQLISRGLIQQQIREEDAEASNPQEAEVQARVGELRREFPACVRENCASEAGWNSFLLKNGLTRDRLEAYMRLRLEILRFIETRFRQGIRISQQEIEAYYRNTLLPQYKPGSKIPPLETVSARIEEILLQQQVNALFSAWLENLRKQGDVEILDPALEAPVTDGGGATP